ncbi:MAG: PrpF domain-containing protein [Christensenellales bacterium]
MVLLNDMYGLHCTIMRGGTSKGIFINEKELPKDRLERDRVIRAVFGSPDIRQIDGLGGADVLTSKLAIIGPPTRSDADVDYTFAQVGIDTEIVDYKGNCGNISSAVGPYAIDEGLVTATDPITKVRIHMTNTGRILIAEVPTRNGKSIVKGDFHIDGVPGTGAKITMDWADTGGGFTGKLLPSGNVKDVICIDNKEYEVTLIDAGNPLVVINAAALGISGTESPSEIEANLELMSTIEKIRGIAATVFGLCEIPTEAARISPYNPFFAIVSKPSSYIAINGQPVNAQNTDIVSRLLFMLHMHKAYPITGTVATGIAACIPGSVAYEAAREETFKNGIVRIAHPSGIISVEVDVEADEGQFTLRRVGVYRTARRIMDGTVYVLTTT